MNESPSPLVFDAISTQSTHARNFRSPAWLLQNETENQKKVVIDGLEHLKASASGQFSESEIKTLETKLKGKRLWLVDLRGESHGFINGKAVSWYGFRNLDNQGLTLNEITQVEAKKLAQLQPPLVVSHIVKKVGGEIRELKPESVTPNRVESEADLAKRLGFQYARLPVVDRHPPAPQSVDGFIQLVQAMGDNDWLHLHCRAGKGRTTTFMVLYDILLNGQKVSVEDIIKRHAYFGPKDLNKLPNKPDNVWKREPAKKRLAFIRDFYTYRNSQVFGNQTWEQWLKSQTT